MCAEEVCFFPFFFFNDTATTEIYTLSPTRRSSDLDGRAEGRKVTGQGWGKNRGWARVLTPGCFLAGRPGTGGTGRVVGGAAVAEGWPTGRTAGCRPGRMRGAAAPVDSTSGRHGGAARSGSRSGGGEAPPPPPPALGGSRAGPPRRW